MPRVIPPSPSDPSSSLQSSVTFEAECSATLQQLQWIESDTAFEVSTQYSTGTLVDIGLDPVSFILEDTLCHFYLTQISASVTFEAYFEQNYTEQLIIDDTATDSGDVEGRLNNLERDFVTSSENPGFYKEFSYSGTDIAGYKLYTSASKITEVFDVAFTFTSGLLTEKVITRISDNSVLTVTYGYTGDQLQSQTRSIS